MTIAAGAPGWLAALLLLLLTLAAVEDGWRLRISNLLVVAIAATGVAAIVLAGIGWSAWQPFALSLAILVVGTPLFAAGWIGGGDVKLLAASASWFMLDGGWRMLIAVAIAGGVLTIFALIVRLFPLPDRARNRVALLRRGSGIPYGIAVALGVGAIVSATRSALI
jgi:prepilin peptidase CpaA